MFKVYDNPTVVPFQDFDLMELITCINENDIDIYVRKSMFKRYGGMIPATLDFEAQVQYEIETIRQYLINQGYYMYKNESSSDWGRFIDVKDEKSSIDKNLEKTNINLNKEIRKLRHNVSQLQKQINQLKGELYE